MPAGYMSKMCCCPSKEKTPKHGVKVEDRGIPGSSFYQGSEGENFIRFCFAKDDATLRDAVARLRQFRS